LVTTFAGAAFDDTFFWVSGAAAAITYWWNYAIAVLCCGLCCVSTRQDYDKKLLTLLKLGQDGLYVRVLHHIQLGSTWSLRYSFSLQSRALTCFPSHYKRRLPTHTHLLRLTQKRFTLLNAVAWLMHVVLLGFRRCCWSWLRLAGFTLTYCSFVADLFRRFSVHRISLRFAGRDHIHVAGLDSLPIVWVN
jgi:hypothetical protein